jgi:putative two-component system response regulator
MIKSKGRILIVDDEIYIQEVLRATLQDAGFECVTVDSTESALSALASDGFDLVFADIRMPGKQGTELLRDIKSSYPNVVVIMITAVDSAGPAIESIRMGAYDYIIKPFNLDQILVAAERGLDKIRLENANREYQKYLEQIAEERAAETRRLFYSMTQAFIRLLDLKAPFNEGHALRVAEKSRYVARELRMTEDGVRKVYLAALLHDVGMILVEDVLLNKQSALTPEEQRYMQSRGTRIEEVLKPVLDDEEVLKFIRHNREHYDGTGYPAGLKGNLIPLGARVISVAETFDAIISGRPYRLPKSPQEAIKELARCAQSQFDPQVVTIFADLYDRVFRNQ